MTAARSSDNPLRLERALAQIAFNSRHRLEVSHLATPAVLGKAALGMVAVQPLIWSSRHLSVVDGSVQTGGVPGVGPDHPAQNDPRATAKMLCAT